jgi:uncharacterized membrane protein
MKASTLKVAVACGALGVSLSASSHAQQQGQAFQLAFCNISAYSNVTVALVHKKDAEKWAVDGWYPVPDNGCTVVGTFQRDTVYYFAEGRSGNSIGVWAAPDNDQNATSQCIDHNKWFQQTAGVPTCPTGQEVVRFRMISVPANSSRITWTLSGGK